jgi:putative flippase GtrA
VLRLLVHMEFARFVANGLVATAVHFTVLTVLLDLAHVPLAAAANFVAALFGIAVSFIGNRTFVFRQGEGKLSGQLPRFAGLYLAMAGLHALVLYFWTDRWGLDYRLGFVMATSMQVLLSYLGNRILVFPS